MSHGRERGKGVVVRRRRSALARLRAGERVALGSCRIVASSVDGPTVVQVRCERCEVPCAPGDHESARSCLASLDAPDAVRDDPARFKPLRSFGDGGHGSSPALLDGTRSMPVRSGREAIWRTVPCRRGGLARHLARAQLELLSSPGISAALVRELAASLACSPEPLARIELARHEACPPEVLGVLACDWWWEVRSAVAARPQCPRGLAEQLALDPSPWVRRALAENEQAPPEVLRILAGDVDFGIRDAIAEHAHCPAEVLDQLSQDEAWEIRRSIAKRADAPPSALRRLARDPEHWVRFFVACNPATHAHVRRELEADPRPSVRAVAANAGARGRPLVMYLALDRRAQRPSPRPEARSAPQGP